MAVAVNVINTYFGRCRCCLGYGYLKNMWEEHYRDGDKEIFVEMLVECFALEWEQSDGASKYDQICETCIIRLRDALSFKRTILESQMKLLNHSEEQEMPIKIGQIVECKEEPQIEDVGDSSQNTGDVTDDQDSGDQDYPDGPCYLDPDEQEEANYEDVEYLEDDDIIMHYMPQREKDILPIREAKWPKKITNSERYKTCKQYSEEDLDTCMKAVKNDNITLSEAAKKFNIPRSTIRGNLRNNGKEHFVKEVRDVKQMNREKRIEFIKEIKTILSYTNATPFKCLVNTYICAYCSPGGPSFGNPNDLRSHTRTHHTKERTQQIEYVLRPYWMNEILRLDIHDLKCIVCAGSFPDWNDMLQHLKNMHSIELNHALTKAIPYDLTDKLKCALCKRNFTYYNTLDAHMNSHYNNYVCFDCGETCLTEARFKRHVKIHDIAKHACSICHKVFAGLQDKAKHEETVHNLQPKFKCQYCDERFSGEYLRHMHLLDKHNEKVNVMTCEFCGKTFTWRPYYRKHMRKHDDNTKKFECEICAKRFYLETELKDHVLKHKAEKKLTCYLCNKKYTALASLRRHINSHKRLGV